MGQVLIKGAQRVEVTTGRQQREREGVREPDGE